MRNLGDLPFGLLHGGTQLLDDVLRDALESTEVRDAVHMLVMRLTGHLPQLLFIRIFDADGVHGDPLILQALGVWLNGVLRLTICDDNSNLGHIFSGTASCSFHKLLLQDEVQSLASHCASTQVWQLVNVVENLLFVLIGVEVKLSAGIVAVLRQANANMIRSDIEAVYQSVEEIPDTLEVLRSNTPGTINQEDNISHSLLCAYWEKDTHSSK